MNDMVKALQQRKEARQQTSEWKCLDFIFRYLNQHAGELSPNDRKWAIICEERFRESDELSPRMTEITNDIFRRY